MEIQDDIQNCRQNVNFLIIQLKQLKSRQNADFIMLVYSKAVAILPDPAK